MKNPWVIIGVITVLLFGGAIWYAGQAAEKSNEGVELIKHTKGNASAAVTLVEYSDFQCPACQAFHPILKTVLEESGDNIHFEYKHFPLPIHQHAMMAAVAAEAAGQQGKFFEFHDVLFDNQAEWAQSTSPNILFTKYANEVDLDVDVFRRQLNSSILRDKVRQEMTEGRNLGVTGTPTFFLNGERMQFDSYQSFVEQIALAVNPALASTSNMQMAPSSDVKFGL